MRKWLIVGLLLSAVNVNAQSLDLGGIGQTISDIALSARGGTGVDLKGRVDGLVFVPFPALHSADGLTEYGCLGVGADISDGISGTKVHGAPLILPMINPIAVIGYLFKGAWPQAHLNFFKTQVEAGIGVKPLPVTGSHGKFVIGNQVEAAATFKFGK